MTVVLQIHGPCLLYFQTQVVVGFHGVTGSNTRLATTTLTHYELLEESTAATHVPLAKLQIKVEIATTALLASMGTKTPWLHAKTAQQGHTMVQWDSRALGRALLALQDGTVQGGKIE